ncbi:MAG: bifunctional diaminohydroxyphosphoribosylaminopyrimidine deaminase/5-amino-6-(5-phosphoribosylamino)uracil reductase RibD [Duncaniella sp.]|nr:bifunctional diaminohydroxyphosphoribosylaminopyrimidine deaminase/5-amino-6-(5-phosphoribosylamino)uracil reductase RibD [Duncaniella sp.]MDE6066994.1 bifunctional diaminohydroxyphosphoribosylaminopyrimidine deaminase/5-amino-6-(5-phosphoribosylamino)uracil reductase RibD [Duncaniella sp.]
MRRAIELARHGLLDASPNPMVGAVIVDPAGRIIGEGWHRRCGEGHAEVNAVASVADPALLRDATMYVTLEPCSHYGKTPPCAQLIIDRGIPRVVVGCLDPFEKVAGRGVKMLREAGVEVTVGCLEAECVSLNKRFITAHRLHRPYVTLKWAESSDGYIDGHISTPLTSMLVHRLRAANDAILIGSGTWLADTPRLDTRLYAGRSPLRVILDRRGRTGLVSDGNTLVYTGNMFLTEVLADLYKRGVTSLLVEGGADVLRSFISENLWDAIRIERGDKPLGGSVKAPSLSPLCRVIDTCHVDGNTIINISK